MHKSIPLTTHAIHTPFGWLSAAASENGLIKTSFFHTTHEAAIAELTASLSSSHRLCHDTNPPWSDSIQSFFTSHSSGAILFDSSFWTPFQKKIYTYLLMHVPAGTLVSYSELAKQTANKNAVRAVGAAMRRNPVAPFIPCHRVVSVNGLLTGYSGSGGLSTKQALLESEGIDVSPGFFIDPMKHLRGNAA